MCGLNPFSSEKHLLDTVGDGGVIDTYRATAEQSGE
jgi:hypothetical protein